MGEKSELHRDYVLELESELRELEKREESSTRRMQILVYPAMVAFIILAAYGFFLVHSLTKDVGKMAVSIVTIADSVDTNMKVISNSTVEMSEKMTSLAKSTESMTGKVGNMSSDVGSMSQNIGAMTDSTSSLATSTNNMQQDMWSLNQNVSTPLSMFNKFLPWSNNSNGRFRGSNRQAQPQQPPVYYQPYPEQAAQPVQQ
ncbi:MAG: hypothetical protein V3U78_07855 [Thiotrichaceae bacterium]